MIYIRITREMLDTFVSRFRYAMEYLICRGDRYVSKYTLYIPFVSKINPSKSKFFLHKYLHFSLDAQYL